MWCPIRSGRIASPVVTAPVMSLLRDMTTYSVPLVSEVDRTLGHNKGSADLSGIFLFLLRHLFCTVQPSVQLCPSAHLLCCYHLGSLFPVKVFLNLQTEDCSYLMRTLWFREKSHLCGFANFSFCADFFMAMNNICVAVYSSSSSCHSLAL